MKQQPNVRSLFVEPSPDARNVVVLNWSGSAIRKFDLYAASYRSSARRLLDRSSPDELRDVFACPIIYLYRHSLELFLKEILVAGQQVLRLRGADFRPAQDFLISHSLVELWKQMRVLFANIGWGENDTLDSFFGVIEEFDSFDRVSFSFRYPVTKKGEAALEQDFRFDLGYFCDRIDEVINELESLSCALSEDNI